MSFDERHFSFGCSSQSLNDLRRPANVVAPKYRIIIFLLVFYTILQLTGCVSDKVDGSYAYLDKDAYLIRTTVIDEKEGTSKSETSMVTVKGADEPSALTSYRQTLTDQSPQDREDTEGQNPLRPLGLLKLAPSQAGAMPDIETITDPNTGKKSVALTIEQAIARTLANSPEIRVVTQLCFDTQLGRFGRQDPSYPP